MPHFYATNLGGGGGGSGSVTSVGVNTDTTTSSIFANTANKITNSPITSSGVMTLTLSTQTANTHLSGPTSGGAAAPAFRALVAADIPDVSATYLTKANNLSDVSTKATAFDNISPMTTLGDLIYGGASGTNTRLAGNITVTKKFLTQTGNASVSAAPGWNTIVAGDISGLTVTWTGAAQFNNGVTMHSTNLVFDTLGTGNITFSDGFSAITQNSAGLISFYNKVNGSSSQAIVIDVYGKGYWNPNVAGVALRGGAATGNQFVPNNDNQWSCGGDTQAWQYAVSYIYRGSDTASSTVGQAVTVRAGNCSGSGAGGALTVAAGTSGSGTAGVINFQTSGATSYQITAGNLFKNVLSANESTGAGSALLGANSPAGTLTAPYTWIKMISSDASTVYYPVWK